MTDFAIIENDSGLIVVSIPSDSTPEKIAIEQGGFLIDPGPFHSFDQAYDAMLAIPREEDEP